MAKKVSVFYTHTAREGLQSLEKKDAGRVVLTIEKYTSDKNPLSRAKKLTGIFDGLYRYRIGNYRAVFQYDEKGNLIMITILKIKHRKDVYR